MIIKDPKTGQEFEVHEDGTITPINQTPANPTAGLQSIAPIAIHSGVDAVTGGGAAAEPFAVGTATNGGTLMSDGSVVGGGPFSLSGIGSSGNAILPIAGTMGAIDLFSNKRHGGRGALQGAASGAAIGSYFGPVGTGAGAIIGGGLGYFGNFGDKDMYRTEGDRIDKLRKQGYKIAQINPRLTKGQSKEELVAQAKVLGEKTGNPNYVKFAETRDEKYLTPEGTAAAAINYETLGQDYAKASKAKRDEYQNQLIAKGLYREHHGTLDYTDAAAAKAVWDSLKDFKGKDMKTKTQASKSNPGLKSIQPGASNDVGFKIDPELEKSLQAQDGFLRKNEKIDKINQVLGLSNIDPGRVVLPTPNKVIGGGKFNRPYDIAENTYGSPSARLDSLLPNIYDRYKQRLFVS